MVSICIPAYQKTDYVIRLINSLTKQSYKDFEIIISDDSQNEDIKEALIQYTSFLNISYYHHSVPLKSPRNWNFAIEKSIGKYFMLIHQDDWLNDEKALETFVQILENNNDIDFVFSKNTAVKENGEVIILQGMKSLLYKMYDYPFRLVISDVIGPPSNVMLRREVKKKVIYDENFIWLVDVDYYIRLLQSGFKYYYVDKHLVSIGLHKDQTTEYCLNNRHIMFKENVWLAKKIERFIYSDILVYDYYWRLLRNYSITNIFDFQKNNIPIKEIPPFLKKAFLIQQKIPRQILKIGVFSKVLMSISYLFNRAR